MPSPLGHALAGVAIAWTAEAIRRQPMTVEPRFTLAGACLALAVGPDLDFLYPPSHRMMTHSLAAGLCVGATVWVLHRERRDGWIVALICATAYGSHLLLDWLGGDTKLPAGLQLLWPFSREWFISDIHLFRATDIGGMLKPRVMLSNAVAVLLEGLIVAPCAWAAYWWRRRAVSTAARSAEDWTAASRISDNRRR